MKAAIFCLFALAAVAMARPGGEQKYTSKYDNLNLSEILGNHNLLKGYINCVLEKGRCTPEGKELRSHISEALENDCAKCTDTQRSGTRQTLGHLINHEPAFWDDLKQKFDPKGKYSVKYEKELREIKA